MPEHTAAKVQPPGMAATEGSPGADQQLALAAPVESEDQTTVRGGPASPPYSVDTERQTLEGDVARRAMNALVLSLDAPSARQRLDAVLSRLDRTLPPELQVEYLQVHWMHAATDICQQALVPFGFQPDIEGIALTQALVQLQDAARDDPVLSFQFYNLKQKFSPPLSLRTWQQTESGALVRGEKRRGGHHNLGGASGSIGTDVQLSRPSSTSPDPPSVS